MIARKLAPIQGQSCFTCSTQQGFAASYSKYCLRCEAESIRTCRSCKEHKPLTSFALCQSGQDGRERHCKECKELARQGKPLTIRCKDCNTVFTPRAGGDIYCEQCRDKPRQQERKPKQATTIFTSILYSNWKTPQAARK